MIGAAIEVHRTLGPGFLEAIYEEAFAIELQLRQVPFKRQHVISVGYKGYSVGENRLDLFIDDKLIVELKAVEALLPIQTAQVLSYLRATDCRLGLLMNFNLPVLKAGHQTHSSLAKEAFLRIPSWRPWRLGGSNRF